MFLDGAFFTSRPGLQAQRKVLADLATHVPGKYVQKTVNPITEHSYTKSHAK